MSHELNAMIATADLLRVVAAEVPAARVVDLAQGLALIPMTDRLHDALQQPDSGPDLGFKRFPGGNTLRFAAWSKSAPIAYLEAVLPGGPQRAAVWHDGRLVLTPDGPSPDAADRALRLLGTDRAAHPDESTALALATLAAHARAAHDGPEQQDATG